MLLKQSDEPIDRVIVCCYLDFSLLSVSVCRFFYELAIELTFFFRYLLISTST